jgi:hypothetical protein
MRLHEWFRAAPQLVFTAVPVCLKFMRFHAA